MKTAQDIIDAYDGGWLDLSWCDLTGITLPTSIGGSLDLSWCDLTGITLPTSIGGSLDLHKSPWNVTITSEQMTIGCKTFAHQQWAEFSDSKISAMEPTALAFWKKNKPELMRLCAHMAQRATTLGGVVLIPGTAGNSGHSSPDRSKAPC